MHSKFAVFLLLIAFSCNSDELELDFDFVEKLGSSLAAEILTASNDIYSQSRRLTIFINNQNYGVRTVNAQRIAEQPCLSMAVFKDVNFTADFLDQYVNKQQQCLLIDDKIGASMHYNTGEQALNVSLPQVSFYQQSVEFSDWQFGDNGLNLQYQFNANGGSGTDIAYYAALNGKVNVNTWRFAFSGYANENDAEINHLVAYRDLPSLPAQVSIGNVFLQSDRVDGFSFDGISLKSDRSMQPWATKYYSPVIRGVANSNARIEVSQSGRVIFSDIITPGPYEYSDYGYVSNGDISVKVTEESGEESTMLYPVSILPSIIAADTNNFQLVAGDNSNLAQGYFIYADYQQGYEQLTLSASTLFAVDYQDIGIGVGSDLAQLGAISFGLNGSVYDSDLPSQQRVSGWRYSFQYAKSLSDATTISLVNYGYQDANYRSFNQIEQEDDNLDNMKNKLQINLQQRFGYGISASFSGYFTDYWDDNISRGGNVSVSVPYNRINFSVTGSYSDTDGSINYSNNNYQLSFAVSVPLGGSEYSYSSVSYANGEASFNSNLSGQIDTDTNYSLSWNGGESYSGTTSGTVSHDTGKINASAGLSYSADATRWSSSLSGSVLKVADSELLFTSQTYNSFVLVNIADEPGISFKYGSAKTASDGLLASQLSSYGYNDRYIDTSSLSTNLLLNDLRYQFNPTYDAMFYYDNIVSRINRLVVVLQADIDIPIGAKVRLGDEVLTTVGMNNIAMLQLGDDDEYRLAVFNRDDYLCQIEVINTEAADVNSSTVNVKNLACKP